MAENNDTTMALATSTSVRFGVAMNVVRIIPLRYSAVIVMDASTINTGTPNTAAPSAARSGPNGAPSWATTP